MMKSPVKVLSCLLSVACISAASLDANANTAVFSTDFNSAMPTEITAGAAMLVGVQGFSGYGALGNQFGGNFLRSATGNVVTLSLTGLQAHTSLSVDFLFAAIDSLDGTGTFPSGDYFRVTLDGVQLFRESFANAAPYQIQSYAPPTGVLLARHENLGFGGPGGYHTDSAYYLGGDPVFQNIAHSSATATFTFQIEGVGNQELSDESWAMDNLKVSVSPVPEPETYTMLIAGLALMGVWRRTHRPKG